MGQAGAEAEGQDGEEDAVAEVDAPCPLHPCRIRVHAKKEERVDQAHFPEEVPDGTRLHDAEARGSHKDAGCYESHQYRDPEPFGKDMGYQDQGEDHEEDPRCVVYRQGRSAWYPPVYGGTGSGARENARRSVPAHEKHLRFEFHAELFPGLALCELDQGPQGRRRWRRPR